MKFIYQKNYSGNINKCKKKIIGKCNNNFVNKKKKILTKIKKVVKRHEKVNNNINDENHESLNLLNSENNERIWNDDLNININICKEKKHNLVLIWDYENPCNK
jgi:hypothetical protein